MTQSEFNDLWITDEIPACDEGMVLLKRFADEQPQLFFNTETRPETISWLLDNVAGVPEWDAFAEHVANCDDCMER